MCEYIKHALEYFPNINHTYFKFKVQDPIGRRKKFKGLILMKIKWEVEFQAFMR